MQHQKTPAQEFDLHETLTLKAVRVIAEFSNLCRLHVYARRSARVISTREIKSNNTNGVKVDMEKTRTTTDHEQIKLWVEERGGHPARVKGPAVEGSSGVLLIDYPGYSSTQTLEAISWHEFFKGFEENELAFLCQDEKKAGSQTRFSKLVNRDAPPQWKGPVVAG